MKEIYEVEIDGFSLEVEIYTSDYTSLDFEIETMFDLDNDSKELDSEIFEMILEDNEDTIKELIETQIIEEIN